MPDAGTRYTDKQFDELVKRFNAIFRDAQKEITDRLDNQVKRMNALDQEKRALVKAGELSEEKYKSWLQGQLFMQKRWKDELTNVCSTLMQADSQCRAMVEGAKRAVFGENATYQCYSLERTAGYDLGFTVYDSATVTRLLRDQPELMPRKVVDGVKQEAWEQKKIANAIAAGVILGESIPKIADRIAKETTAANEKAVIRYARTCMTEAQNAGRLEAMDEAEKMGIQVLKVWIATLDDRTRDAHAELDGQTREVKEPFESILGDIMYPGDPNADEANVWNCRCALGWDYKEYPNKDYTRRDNIDGELIEYMDYNRWQELKHPDAYHARMVREGKEEPPQKQQAAQQAQQPADQGGEGFVIKAVAVNGVDVPEGYNKILQDRFEAADEAYKVVYEHYVPKDNDVVEANTPGQKAYMDDRTGEVHLNYRKDLDNARTPGSTWFHEHGHVIDRAMGNVSRNDAFLQAIKNDVKAYEQKIKAEKGLKKIDDVRFAVGWAIDKVGAHTHSIQDIYGGVIKKPYPMVTYSHPAWYWKGWGDYGVSMEAFAHMCEASSSKEKQGYMQEYLPTAWKWFTNFIEDKAKEIKQK